MAVFEIQGPDGGIYEVDAPDERAAVSGFQKFSSNQQPAASEPAADKYQTAATQERDTLQSKGVDTGAGFARRFIHGRTFGLDDELLAAASTPLEMIKRGTFNPAEGYRYAKAREDLIMDDSRKETGVLGSIAEIGGGVGTGLDAARSGITFARNLAPNAGLAARSAAAAGDGLGFGVLSGAAEGNSLSERGGNAAIGGIAGGLLGGALPGAMALGGQVAAPFISNIAARINPEGYATRQLARALSESGRNVPQVAGDVSTAAAEGQGMFTVADALGNPGQRLLSSVTRAPGAGRTEAVEFLERRQGGQGRRISNALTEGFDSPQTAEQLRGAMTGARDTEAAAAYGAARNNAGRVDVTPAINNLDRVIGTQPGQVLTPANDSIEAVLTPFRQRLARVNPDDFEAVQRIRGDMADAAQSAIQSGQGNRARLIRDAVRQLDTAMEGASTGFRDANRNFAQSSRNIDAIDQGRDAALRGRTEDTIPAFQGLTPEGQTGFRTGYVDPLIQQAQGAAFGANKARPLINDAFADEAGAMAPGNPLMQRRIGRENTMFETRHHALGGSKTVENLADDGALGIDPSIITNIVTGNFAGAARGVLSAGTNLLTGNTAEVREALARMLLERGQARGVQNALTQAQALINRTHQTMQLLSRGAMGGAATLPSQRQ